MSTFAARGPGARPITVHDLAAAKARGDRFAMLTAYDHPTAAVLDEAGIPVLLVGDSVGDNVLGHPTTVPVTLDEMVHHTRAVSRGTSNALVVADLPFGTYHVSVEDGLRAAFRLVQEGGARAVKAEGAKTELVRRLVDAGVPFMGHVGLTPQSVHQIGYRVQGRDAEAADQIRADARALQDAGAFAIVIEAVPASLGRQITDELTIPTIGIGAGSDTDGQVLVLHDLIGLSSRPTPKFAKTYVAGRELLTDAAKAFQAEVADRVFPGHEHEF